MRTFRRRLASGGDSSKHADAGSDTDGVGAATRKAGGSMCSGLFDGCGTERPSAETSSSSGKIAETNSGRAKSS